MPQLSGLYAITPDQHDLPELLAAAEAVLSGGACLLQFRRKRTPPARLASEAAAVLDCCRRFATPLIINDDVELAARIGADGVHLGRDDGDVRAARRRLGRSAIIGRSCYDSFAAAQTAVDDGADYVALGSVYPTSRKPGAPRASFELLRLAATALPVPACAIGGISRINAQAVLDTGVAMLAVIGDLFDNDDPAGASAEFAALFSRAAQRG